MIGDRFLKLYLFEVQKRLFHIPFSQLYDPLVSGEDFLPVSSLSILSIENILESLETDDIKKKF